ncbi:class I SAM-dependent methyltransferase [Clostridiaceae bacterium 35-E11]
MAIFDAIALDYDQWYESKMGKFVDKVETALAFSLFRPQRGMKILDVGCGTGNFSIKLAEMGCEVTAIDISEEMLQIARKKAEEKKLDITFQKMDIYNLKFKDGSFEAVFSMAAFEFIEEPKKAYDEMYRVLNKDGQLLIGTIHKDSHWGRLYLSKVFQENTIFQYAHFKSMEELRELDLKHLVDSGECLFIPPNTAEEDITMEKEQRFSKEGRGGYICALWKKTE